MDRVKSGLGLGLKGGSTLEGLKGSKSGLEVVAVPEHYSGLEVVQSPYNWHRFHIVQVSNSTQHVALQPDPVLSHYPTHDVKSNIDTGFMNRKPDVLIYPEGDKKAPAATGRFEKYGVGTTVEYPNTSLKQQIQLESSLTQRYHLSLNGRSCTWQPHATEKNVLDLEMSGEAVVARITASRLMTVEKGSLVAVLQIRGDIAKQDGMLNQVLCTGVVLVERLKRRTKRATGLPDDGTCYWAAMGGGTAVLAT